MRSLTECRQLLTDLRVRLRALDKGGWKFRITGNGHRVALTQDRAGLRLPNDRSERYVIFSPVMEAVQGGCHRWKVTISSDWPYPIVATQQSISVSGGDVQEVAAGMINCVSNGGALSKAFGYSDIFGFVDK